LPVISATNGYSGWQMDQRGRHLVEVLSFFPPQSSLKVADLLLLRLEYGDGICKQVLRLGSAVAGTSTYQGEKRTSNLASKL
jgi:hypothetical protein